MRILYFSNIAITPDALSGAGGGGWIASLLLEMEKSNNQIAVGHFGFKESKETYGSITVYNMSVYKGCWLRKCITHALRISKISPLLTINDVSSEKKSWPYFEKKMLHVIKDFDPDIIHVFGSESYYGLIASLTNVPVVLHIQGLLNPIGNAYLPPFMSWTPQYAIFHPWKWVNYIVDRRKLAKDCYREKEILSRVHNFIGRTDWDMNVLCCFNPKAVYYYGGEILREVFYEPSVRSLPDRLTIVSTISKPSYKGIDMVLKTAYVLRNYMHMQFSWKVFGDPNEDVIALTGISPSDVGVEVCGKVPSDVLKKELLNCTCYMHPSYIDNSPNSLCEAQILGVSTVACNVGGVSSIIVDGVTGFLVPSNDPYQASYIINKLFIDKALNASIGLESKEIALKRHNIDDILSQTLDVYSAVLSHNDV